MTKNIRSDETDLLDDKAKLLLLLLKETGLQESQDSPILTQSEEYEASPLSFAQQRLWFLDQLEPDSAFYNIVSVYRFSGKLDVAVLQDTLKEIVRRHQILRTTFAIQEQGTALQVVAPELSIPLIQRDLREYDQDERESQLLQWANAELQKPFDLEHGPLLRTTLLQLTSHSYALLVCIHHIITDGWSMEVFGRELNAIFAAFAAGKPSPLPELPIQYRDFAVWQRQWLQGESQQQQLDYWRQQLADLPVLALPTDHPRPAVQSYRGMHLYFELPPSLNAQLKMVSRDTGVTLFMVLMATFQTLLFRYCQQQDIAVGVPIANRTREELEPLIGFFVNTLVLRTRFSNDMTFYELLTQVQQIALDAYEHQDIPFEKLVEVLNPGRSLAHTPLFQVLFALQNEVNLASARVSQGPSGWQIDRSVRDENYTSRCDLSLSLTEQDDESLAGVIEYNTDLFEIATMERFIRHFHNLLEEIAKNPHQRLSAISFQEELPLPAHRELDRQVSPPPRRERTANEAPATEMEQTISQLWQDLLDVSQVGRHDNFFDLGGHSLLVVQMRSQLQKSVKKPLSIVDLFTFPTVASLAAYLAQDEEVKEKVALAGVYARAERRKETGRKRATRGR